MKFNIRSGFTLIELLVVIALIIIISGLSINFLSYTDRVLAHLELDKLYSLCLSLHYKAQLEEKTLSLILNPLENSYSFNNKDYHLSKFVKFGVLNNIKGPPSMPSYYLNSSITFKKINKDSNSHVINFYPDGTMSSGALYIIDSKKTYQLALSISVAQISYIRKYIYKTNPMNNFVKWELI